MNDPFGDMAQAAIAAHELFKSYVDAGFTEDQALELIKKMIETSAILNHGSGDVS